MARRATGLKNNRTGCCAYSVYDCVKLTLTAFVPDYAIQQVGVAFAASRVLFITATTTTAHLIYTRGQISLLPDLV
jgi:hypothetical protein